ncbi:MAG: Rieske 2Fe-2S domain-containing protein, partial [Rhodospirillaceae bacterium]|nr:Rieske 2Fe-2S domain-containing protein [Rhodospirillaceae bacterium]
MRTRTGISGSGTTRGLDRTRMARGVTRAGSVMERMEVMMDDDVMAESARVDWDRGGLAPWTYHSEELTELERDVLFRRHWQLACHVSDVAEPGDYVAFDMVGERALILRGGDGRVRAFHNLCRHRGSRGPPRGPGGGGGNVNSAVEWGGEKQPR